MRVSFASPASLLAMSLAISHAAASVGYGNWATYWDSCPRSCDGTTGPSQWGSYHNLQHLSACNRTLVMELSVHNAIGRPDAHVSIRACTASDKTPPTAISESRIAVGKSFSEEQITFQYGSRGQENASSSDAHAALHKLQYHLASRFHGRVTTLFVLSGQTVLGLHLGENIDKKGAAITLAKLIDHVDKGTIATECVLQYCGINANHIFGIVVNTSGDLASAQDIVCQWTEGICQSSFDEAEDLHPLALAMTNTHMINETRHTLERRRSSGHEVFHTRDSATCSTIKVAGGDTCATLATTCGISPDDFTKYNLDKDTCSTLTPGMHVCCSAGALPNFTPKPNADGTCKSYYVQSEESCSTIGAANSITEKQIETFNKNTWGWMGCADLQAKSTMCISSGDPPMPAIVPNAVCGPQVNGTERPTDGTKLEAMNPCPLNACCDIWGQCGITKDFCTAGDSETGAPGTAKKGENGCISNCGTDIVNNDQAPDKFRKVGYFEAFNWNRPCLNMDISSFDTSTYTHVHFAFAGISSNYAIDISDVEDQFQKFTALKGVKRILSFGGWSFSTLQDSFPIFRDGVTDSNRKAFARNVVDFLDKYDLDGVDFDWEYPGAPDIPGIPPGSKNDGPNYLQFLKDVQDILPSSRSLSIAAPASFWYLRGFPIDKMSEVVDYIIYMTYDLHGQWDYDHHWAVPDCPNTHTGCLRSHVNLTETSLSLSMVKKAGVPSHKIVVGISSYGRSFQMAEAECTGSNCAFTGPESGAKKGRCTDTAGYISNAEIHDILATDKTAKKSYDQGSDSNIVVYGTDQWIAYMDDATKASRTNFYKDLKMGGTSDWAVDLQIYNYGEGDSGQEREGDLLYIAPSLWQEQSPAIACEPPCTFVLPPYPLSTTTTITWPTWTAYFLYSSKGQFVSTKTTTLTVEAFVTSYIDLWPITVDSTDTDPATIQVTQSIKPPPFVHTLEPGEATFPPTPFFTPEETTPKATSTPAPSTGDVSSSSTSRTIAPAFFTTSHPVTLQPQPTISIPTPMITIPSITYSSGSARPTTTAGCPGCGKYNCKEFGCNGHCGIFACGGGCGIFGCGGGCGLFGCGGGCKGCGHDSCPLERCAPGCSSGECGEHPRASESRCSDIKTATNCVEYCTVTTDAAHLTTTSCTSSLCVPTIGCTATGTTEIITSDAKGETCPTSFPTYATARPDGQDPYDGCKPCRWVNTPTTGNSYVEKRGLAKRKDEGSNWAMTKVANCPPLPTPTTIYWGGGGRFLDEALRNELDATKTIMPRWLTKTTLGCVPTVTTISDKAMGDAIKLRADRLTDKELNDAEKKALQDEIEYQKPTNDHVWERHWMTHFWAEAGIGAGGLTCQQFNQVFFNDGCSSADIFSMLIGQISNNNLWDFVGMTHEVNDQIKGLLGNIEKFDGQLKAMKKLQNSRFWVDRPAGLATVPKSEFRTGRGRLKTQMNFLANIAMSCDVWKMKDVWGSLDASNNRIYSAFIYIDAYSRDNHANDPESMPETNLAEMYRNWMDNYLKATMFQTAREASTGLWEDINAQFLKLWPDAQKTKETAAEYSDLRRAFDLVSDQYGLDNEETSVCQLSRELSWTDRHITPDTKRGLEKRAACPKPTVSNPRPTQADAPPPPAIPTIPPANRPLCYREHPKPDMLTFTEAEYEDARKQFCIGRTLHADETQTILIQPNGMTMWAMWATNRTGCAERTDLALDSPCSTWFNDIVQFCDYPMQNVDRYYGGAMVSLADGCIEWSMAKFRANQS